MHPLLVRVLAGDQQAYGDLLTRVASLARSYVQRKLGPNAECDDIVQEILISVHKALHTYDPARPCMPWLAAIMHYRLSDWLRKFYASARIKKIVLDEIRDLLPEPVTATPSDNEHLDEAIRELSPAQQAVIHAMYREDLSVRETSDKLGMSLSAVKVTAHRAYRKLRRRLEGA